MTSRELAARVAALLIERRQTLAVAESSAGGLIASGLLAVPGASAYFLGGAVVYTAQAREALLGITPEMMAGMRASTEGYAKLLAARARGKLGADWGLAETGATGPSGNRYGDAAGHACFAVSGRLAWRMAQDQAPSPGGEAARTLETGSADREANMEAFAVGALRMLEEALTG
jgi:PncC family amidohydrolase